jgi:starch-binding outer membrane protein, SusD/RagB family
MLTANLTPGTYDIIFAYIGRRAATRSGTLGYWVAPDTVPGAVRPELDDIERYNNATETYPVYLPDEMKLIRAEVHARNNELPQAIALINEVRT